MKIGIIGTGNMGRSLGVVFAKVGHEVCFGARTPAQAETAVALAAGVGAAGRVRAGDNDAAAEFGEIVVYTARGVDPAQVLTSASLLDGKIVVDINNQDVPDDFVYPSVTTSLAESLAAQVPGAHVVKAFNTMGQEVFESCPDVIRPYRVSVFVAGDEENARGAVLSLADEIGFVPVDCGPLIHARLLEGAADLIRFLMMGRNLADANFSLAHVPAVAEPKLGGRQQSKLR
jgi:predicted dinucleotide-binding enzyme